MKDLKSLMGKNPLLKKFARKMLVFYSRLLVPKYDIYWQPNFIPLDSVKAKKIITSVHDFSFILYKDFHPKERIEYFEKYFLKNINKSDKIICFSEFTKKEILDKIDIVEKDIHVIYHGINHNMFKVIDNVQVSFDLPKKYIFCVGSIEPRKNLVGLLQAYELLDKKVKEDYKFVLVGFSGWKNKEIMKIIDNNKENIVYLGYLNEEDLVRVYNLASLFVYPSFYEGFGLPPLEAMACGTPVITSNLTSMPEVCGDAAVYCNPYDIEDIKNKMELVLNDKNLQQEMIQKGLKRAKEFTWEKSAKEHIRIFKEVLDT